MTFDSYETLRNDFAEKKVHPMDLKMAAAKYMNQILESVRNRM
jgi:tyrosyl-tRNA synthetase